MTDQERITRLENTLGTLIAWMHGYGVFSSDNVRSLLNMLNDETPQTPLCLSNADPIVPVVPKET